VHYHGNNDHSNTPINHTLGALILNEILSFTDDDLKLRCHTNITFHQALDSSSWEEQPVSNRTFSWIWECCYLYELETVIDLIQAKMEALSGKFAEYFDVSSMKKW